MWAIKKLCFKFFCLVLVSIVLTNCGKAYFPIELKTVSRSERLKGQANEIVNLIPMTKKSVRKANKSNYDRLVIEGGDLDNPAKVIPASVAIKESLPKYQVPGPYLLGQETSCYFLKFFLMEEIFQRCFQDQLLFQMMAILISTK